MRHFLSITALAVLPLTAAAQPQDPPTQLGKMSLPTGAVFRGGFAQPVFKGGFAHPIYPNGFSRMASGSSPGGAIRSHAGPIPRAVPLVQAAADAAAARQANPDLAPRMSMADLSSQRSHVGETPVITPLPSAVRGADSPMPAPTPAPAAEPSDLPAIRAELKAKLAPAPPPPPPRDTCCCSRSRVISTAAAVAAAREIHLRQMDTHLTATEDRSTPSVRPDMHMADAPAAPSPREAAVGSAPASAAESLSEHLRAEPEDFHAVRLLAVSLLNSKRPQEAAQKMLKAYESDPLLAKEPIDLKTAGFEGARVATLVKSAEDAARQSKSPAPWLLAAVLQQAKGSQAQALSALDNARRAGLNTDVSDWLSAELKKSPQRVAQAASK